MRRTTTTNLLFWINLPKPSRKCTIRAWPRSVFYEVKELAHGILPRNRTADATHKHSSHHSKFNSDFWQLKDKIKQNIHIYFLVPIWKIQWFADEHRSAIWIYKFFIHWKVLWIKRRMYFFFYVKKLKLLRFFQSLGSPKMRLGNSLLSRSHKL